MVNRRGGAPDYLNLWNDSQYFRLKAFNKLELERKKVMITLDFLDKKLDKIQSIEKYVKVLFGAVRKILDKGFRSILLSHKSIMQRLITVGLDMIQKGGRFLYLGVFIDLSIKHFWSMVHYYDLVLLLLDDLLGSQVYWTFEKKCLYKKLYLKKFPHMEKYIPVKKAS